MNYRHAFHAGNHCDVLKHAALAYVVSRLAAKDKPFMVLDTHAGRGLYDLESEAARRSGEHAGGINRIFGDSGAPAALHLYFEAIRRQNPFGGLRWYPGSPSIARDALRAGDSMKLCELHPEERVALVAAIGGDSRVKSFDLDGYQAVRAFLPPPERRGLVLIDPPFEKHGEFERLADAVAEGVNRWASGIFIIWLPIKSDADYGRFVKAVDGLAIPATLRAEMSIAPRTENKLTGSSLFVVNPPFGFAAAFAEILPYLATSLSVAPGGGWSLSETEKGRTILDLRGQL